jgi:hypothetical protein
LSSGVQKRTFMYDAEQIKTNTFYITIYLLDFCIVWHSIRLTLGTGLLTKTKKIEAQKKWTEKLKRNFGHQKK